MIDQVAQRRSAVGVAVALALAAAAPASAAADPIVAIFDVEARGAPVSEETLGALSDFLGARLAATGHYRIIPRGQIKERLTRLKVESYKACYDQACQIELGRELAANKSLASRVTGLDGKCLVTLELYDLRSAATDFAHAARVACSEGALFDAFSTGVKVLASWAASRRRPASGPAPVPEPPKVTVYIRSKPPAAEVTIDGLARGKTPLGLNLERGKKHTLALRSVNHRPSVREFVADDGVSFDVALELTPSGRLDLATTSEWMGFGFGPAFIHGSPSAAFATNFRLGTIKWSRFFWTILDLTMMVLPEEFRGSLTSVNGSASVLDVGTRAGYPLYLGRRGQHQLLSGLGVQGQLFSGDGPGYFGLSPGVDYVYNAFDGVVPFGVGVRACLPIARDFGGGVYPWQVFATVNVGFSPYRLVVGSTGAAPAASRPAPGS